MKRETPIATQLAPPLLGGRYRHRRELGRGALGRVVEVEDAIAGGARAAKIVDDASAERLRWELDVLTSLAHPSLVAVHELLRIDEPLPEPFSLEPGSWALIEDLAEGEPSDEIARDLPDLEARARFATRAGAACARALAAIHAAGLVHGDVKPANVVCRRDGSEAKLVDLGLAGPPGPGPVVGTPGLMAPEVWLGVRTPASDLFALGATLWRWLVADDADPGTGSVLRPPRADELPADVPAALRTLVVELLRERPEERPASAREVVRRLDPGEAASTWLDEPSREERARRVDALVLQGRARELEALRHALETPGVVAVTGPAGAGRTRLVREAVRALQSARATAGATVPTWIPGALPARVTHPSIALDDTGTLSVAAARAAVRAAEVAGVELVVVLERDESFEAPGVRRIAVGPIDDASLGALLADALGARVPSAALRSAARAASGGLPGRLCRMIAGGLAEGRDPSRPETMRALGRGEGAPSAVPDAARPLAEALALAGGALRADEARAVDGDATRASALLVGSGLASFDAAGLVLHEARVEPLVRELPTSRRRALARALDRSVRAPLARACVDAALGRHDEATTTFIALAREARTAGNPARAAAILARARARLDPVPEVVVVAEADALRAAGEEVAARTALAGATGRAARALGAELDRLRGELEVATREALALAVGDDEAALDARCVAARIAWSRGEHDEARTLARSVLAAAAERAPARARALEVEVLVALSRGEPDVGALLADLERVAAKLPAPAGLAARARAASLSGSVALAAGDVEGAVERYERSAELAERAGERHLAATATVNLGLARLDAGRLGPAIDALRDGSRRLAALSRAQELGRALFNLGNAAYLAGDDALAQLAAERGRDAARESGDRAAEVLAAIVLADLEVRAGRVRAAIRSLEGLATSDDATRALVDARLAVACAALGEVERARAHAEAARARTPEGAAYDAEVGIAEARAAIAAGESALAEALSMRAYASARTFETRIRSALVAAEAAELSGRRAEAATRLAMARTLLDRAAAGLGPEARARLRSVPAYQRALAATPPVASPVALSRDGRRVLALARRVAAERSPARVLETLAGAALELAGAERAFVLARRESGATVVRCAVGLQGPLGPEHAPSRSIAARVIDERRPMVSVDALEDARWGRAASVHAMALRSVLAVPVPTPQGDTLALCLDDRLRPGAFDEEVLADVAALAELGAASLAAAQRASDARREARTWARRARSLERALDARAEELRALHEASSGTSPFAGIVAASEPMQRVVSLAARVAASGLPVLVVGESGTGKELLARAIHAASARRDAAFVAESCAAIPENLLESALFGHVRGAFTGADRARKGLFEIAHGGTLFLDEIGETSPAMQAKLLRVLQQGEIRSVGSERVKRVDVRLVAASRVGLDTLVAEGRFREDLFYRVAVVTIEVPPLRERLADVEPLVTTLLARHAPGRSVRIDEAALAALRAHAWPGNVRELENELRRALLLADDHIRLEHLSTTVRGEHAPEALPELDLKAQTDALERRLVRRALEVHGGNQTRAAKALGLSRFGLQKMLKRLALDQPK